MKRKMLKVVAAGALLALQGAIADVARADYPDRAIRLVVPFAPGGGVDTLARPFAKELGDALKQTVYVENKASATGQTGAIDVARSAPDGYTLLIHSAAFGTTPAFYPNVPYNPIKDFETITILASAPQILVASQGFNGNTIADVVKTGNKLNFALSASTGIQALATHLLASAGHTDFTHVAYKGAGAAFPDLISGQVDVMIDNPGSSLPFVKSGKLRLIATTGKTRMKSLPDTPAIAETYPGFEALNWFILLAPAGTPDAILDKVHAASLKALASPGVKAMLERDGTDAVGSSRDEARKFLRNEVDKWTKVVKDKNLQVQ